MHFHNLQFIMHIHIIHVSDITYFIQISENGEKTSGEPSSAASDEAVEIAPTSEPCGEWYIIERR